jgi:hypothetical protein
MVEITGHLNGVCLGRATVKIHGPEHSPSRKRFAMQFSINRIHGLRSCWCFPGWCFIFHESSLVCWFPEASSSDTNVQTIVLFD